MTELDEFAKQTRVQMMALEKFPGIVSITDYTHVLEYRAENGHWPENCTGKLIWMNEELLNSEGVHPNSYFNKLKSEVLVEGNKYGEEDLKVLESDQPVSFYNDSRYGREWVKYKYKFTDGDRTYLAAVLIGVEACEVNALRENISGSRRDTEPASSIAR